VDGRGTERVARGLDTSVLRLRLAVHGDRERILLWRNAGETRRHSHDSAPIDTAAHASWFDGVLRAERSALLIGARAGQEVGVLRYDFNGSECTVSIYLVPGQHGRGYGPRLLREGHDWLRRHRPEVTRVRAEVQAANCGSIHAFREAGYEPGGGELYIKCVART
jgi:RimJ/RimL family protein N-acetyltransferase